MNDKNKESFLKVGNALIYPEKFLSNPIGVCSYQAFHEIEKLQAENAKLRECVEFYAQPWERGELDGELLVRKSESYDLFTEVHYKAKQCLKELEDK